jgi:hypothetical protein
MTSSSLAASGERHMSASTRFGRTYGPQRAFRRCDSTIYGIPSPAWAQELPWPSYHRETARPYSGADDGPLRAPGGRSLAQGLEHHRRHNRRGDESEARPPGKRKERRGRRAQEGARPWLSERLPDAVHAIALEDGSVDRPLRSDEADEKNRSRS